MTEPDECPMGHGILGADTVCVECIKPIIKRILRDYEALADYEQAATVQNDPSIGELLAMLGMIWAEIVAD